MTSNYVSPRDYIRSDAYKTINVSGLERKLNNLEKAVVGYISIQEPVNRSEKAKWSPLSPLAEEIPKIVKELEEERLQELIFEFYRQEQPDKLKKILNNAIKALQDEADRYRLSTYPSLTNVKKAGELAAYFKNLLEIDLSDLRYKEFLGGDIGIKTLNFNPKEKRENTFGRHSMRILEKMARDRVLAKYYDGFSNYIVNPNIQVSGIKSPN